MNQEQLDVIVIGAGLAGLSAARSLKEKGLSYKLLEATDRAGGKVQSKVSEDRSSYVELGAQFVNDDMTEMVQLIKESGMKLDDTYIVEDAIIINETKDEVGHIDFDHHAKLLEDRSFRKNHTLSEVVDEVIEDDVEAKAMKSLVASEFTVSSDYINPKALKRLIGNITLEEDEVKYQASGPLSQVIDHLVDISKANLLFEEPVKEISEVEDGYAVLSKTGQTFKTKAVIVAVPPTVARRIQFSERLKEKFQPALNSFIDGAVIKLTFTYEEPFWREITINGEKKKLFGVLFGEEEGVNVMESSKKLGENRLTMFVGGDKAIELTRVSHDKRIEFAVNRLAQVLGERVEDYKSIEEKVWVDSPYYGGGYGGITHYGGALDAKYTLKEPYQNIVFASTELAPAFPQFMEGAVLSGKYAVRQLLKELIE